MKKKKILAGVLLGILAIMFVFGIIFDFSTKLQQALKEKTYQILNEVSMHYNDAFTTRINAHIQILESIAASIIYISDISKEKTREILQSTVVSSGFERANLTDINGVGYTNLGIEINIADRDYFQKAVHGVNTISEPLISMVNGEPIIVLAVPVKKDGEIVGVLSGIYPTQLVNHVLMDRSYYGNEYGIIISKNGDIIFASEHTDKLCDKENFFDFISQADFEGYSLSELKAALLKNETGTFAFSYNGAKRFASFISAGINDWYTISFASNSGALQEETIVNELVFNIVWKLILLFFTVLLLIIIEKRQHNKQILAATKRYQSLLNNINGGMIVAIFSQNPADTIATYVSSGFTDMTGYTIEDIQNNYNSRYPNIIIEDDRKATFEKYLEQIAVGNIYRMTYRIRKKDASVIWVMDNGYIVEEDDRVLYNHSILTDITAMKSQEEELRLSENRFAIAINASSGTLFEMDLKKQLYTHFENPERIFGVKAEKLLNDTREFASLTYDEFVDAITNYFFHPADRDIAKSAMKGLEKDGTTSYEARLRRYDNSYIWSRIDLSLSVDEFGLPLRLVGYMSDIDDMKKHTELLESKMQIDPMTGLYNKTSTLSLCNQAFSLYPYNLHALIVLDIDNFKGVNDTLGHAFGDAVLMDVSAKLKQLFRSDDIVGRVGGDEFVILMKNIQNTDRVLKKMAEISMIFHQSFAGEHKNYKISCSMGIVIFNNKNDTFETLFPKADSALYEAKRSGKDTFVLYDNEKASKYPTVSPRMDTIDNLASQKNINQQVFDLLYEAKNFSDSINMALSMIGRQYNISRVYVFENSADNLYTKNIFEWCNSGISKQIDNFQNAPLVYGDENYLSYFANDGLLYCNDVRNLPEFQRNLLEPQGILSTLQMEVFNGDVISGFIGFDDCVNYHVWTADEIATLSFLTKMIGVFLLKNKSEAALLQNLENRLKILNTLPDYICVVNPETHCLEYANIKMQALMPNVKQGAFCFKTLRGGQKTPCETCLIEQLKNDSLNNVEIVSEDKSMTLEMNATYINWSEQKKMVMFYGKEK